MKEIDNVIESVFKYAKVIQEKGVSEKVFNEIKSIGEIEFEFADKRNALASSINLASIMQVLEDEKDIPELIRHQYIVDKLDKERIHELGKMIVDP